MVMIRVSDNDSQTLGLMGFYGDEALYHDLLAKQLLMLIREDLGEFIIRHHKNDEFSALRAAEAIKGFAYLAGHGRQMLQKLANQNVSVFGNVVNTMEKLQYLFATRNISTKGNAGHQKD